MMIVEQGQVVELCAEPGVFTYDSKATPSIFTGNLKEGLKGAAKDAWDRFKFGGGAGRDQRIYYFNTKEIVGNKYGTVNPVPFRVVDRNIGLDIDIAIRCNGEYSYRIVNPMLFYTNVAEGKFCPECGSPRPADKMGWTCSCGALNKGKFCSECGARKPEGAKLYKCDKCGWEPEDPENPPKFCPECGDIFDDNDVK